MYTSKTDCQVSGFQTNNCVRQDHTLASLIMSESSCLQDKRFVLFIKFEMIDIVSDFKYIGEILDQHLIFKKGVQKKVKSRKYSAKKKKKCYAMTLPYVLIALNVWWQAGETAKNNYSVLLETNPKSSAAINLNKTSYPTICISFFC